MDHACTHLYEECAMHLRGQDDIVLNESIQGLQRYGLSTVDISRSVEMDPAS